MANTQPPNLHLGYTPQELASSPYAKFFKPQMAPLPEHVREAVANGGVAHELLPPVQSASDLQTPGYWPVETGYTLSPDGAIRVFCLTHMPCVTPAMWDWWFAWHGSEAQRYKLWHPQAHVHVAWHDGRADLDHYIGRVSKVVEFVGPSRLDLDIRFVAPASLGLNEARLRADGEVAICARGALSGTPLETGWLVHQLRPVPGGCEMRSRFWLGGDNLRPRGMPGAMGKLVSRLAARLQPLALTQSQELMVHCAQEMNHLARVLPSIYEAFGPRAAA